jgi:glycosyltransferase involved in cell wall biosynthesis
MIKILTFTFHYTKSSFGGAAKSFLNIIEGLNKYGHFQIQNVFFKVKPIYKRFLNASGLGYLIFIPKIIQKIKRFKPHIIITQADIAFPSIISSSLMKIPIVNIIRDPTLICPKDIDIVSYGKSCSGLKNRKTCFNCINDWRTLRNFLEIGVKGKEQSLKTTIATIYYKVRYFITRFNLKLLNYATINLVGSNLMKLIIETNVKSNEVKVLNITPLKRKKILTSYPKKNQLLFLIPDYKEYHKGLEFVLRLAKFIPENYNIIIAGRSLKINKNLGSKIINMGYVVGEELVKLFQESKITLVPSFWTEAFGRVIIESLTNKTPVISSPNCGANQFFDEKEYLKIVPLNLPLWIKSINQIIENPPVINDDDVTQIFNLFSIKKSISDLSHLITKILDYKGNLVQS